MSVRSTLYKTWGQSFSRHFLQDKKIVSSYNFDMIYWDGLGRAMLRYPQMFRAWVTKHVSGSCGTNMQLSRTNHTITNQCPCCNHPDESTVHITRCLDEGRHTMFRQSLEILLNWMDTSGADPDLRECLEQYLLSKGKD